MRRLFLLVVLSYCSYSFADSGTIYCAKGSYGDTKRCALSGSEVCSMLVSGSSYKPMSNWPADGACVSPSRPNGWELMVITKPYTCPKDEYFDLTTFSCTKKPAPATCADLKGSTASCSVSFAGSSGSPIYDGGKMNGCALDVPSAECKIGGGQVSCTITALYTGAEAPPEAMEFHCEPPVPPKDPPKEPDPEEKECPEGTHLEEGLCVPDDITKPEGGGSGEGSGSGSGEGGGSGSGEGGGSGSGSGEGNGTGTGAGNGNGSGEGEGNGTGAGNGSGEGTEQGKCDPTKQECSDEDESSAVGLSCDSSIACKGDAVQCAQLEKQKEIKCATEELYNYNKYEKDLIGVLSSQPQEIKESSNDFKSLVNFSSTSARWLPVAGCPAPLTLNATLSGGNVPIKLDFAGLCAMAEAISGIIVGLAALLGVKIVVGARI